MKRSKFILFIMVIFCCGVQSSACGQDIPESRSIAVVGTGYVGLITGACLADLGHNVVCYDINESKIHLLNNGIIPIYEDGLHEVVSRNCKAGRLAFTSDPNHAIPLASIVFIAVDTPMGASGDADLRSVKAVLEMISHYLDSYKIICMKSTVPVGTCNWAIAELEKKGISKDLFDVVSNPEFLREGSAVYDFMHPDRIVIGSANGAAAEEVARLYTIFKDQNIPLVTTSLVSSETIKYASNAFLACKLSFINEIANLCEKTGATVADVAYGMGLDKRIGTRFLVPGPGFGGSCFPKDCNALLHIAQKNNSALHMIETALSINDRQKKLCVEKLLHAMDGQLSGKTVAVLGLAFKANTDDVRFSPAITALEMLLEQQAYVQAYDPAASENMKKIFPDIFYASTAYEAVSGADAVLIITEWDEFKTIDWQRMQSIMHNHIIVDMRNVVDLKAAKDNNFACYSLGKCE